MHVEIFHARFRGHVHQQGGGREARAVRCGEPFAAALPDVPDDWQPVLASRGFVAMLAHWYQQIESGKADSELIASCLHGHRLAEQLVALAVLMPIVSAIGGNAGTQSVTVAVRAISDLTHNEESKESNRWTGKDGSGWTGLASAIGSWDGTAIISAEMIGGLRPPAARRMLDGLSAPTIDVVITMRDLGRILPSSWQQHVRNTHTQPQRLY